MEITPANTADIPALCSLLEVLFAQEAEFRPDPTAQQRGLETIINNPAVGQILIARQAGKAVGMVSLLYTVSTALGGRVALLEDMVVTPDTRGQGVGAQFSKPCSPGSPTTPSSPTSAQVRCKVRSIN